MTTIATSGKFTAQFNGGSTYFVIDNTGEVWAREDSHRKILGRLKKIAACYR